MHEANESRCGAQFPNISGVRYDVSEDKHLVRIFCVSGLGILCISFSSLNQREMILPVAKLGTLVLKTLSKPLATRLKVQASRHPRFRNLIVYLAQENHRFSVNLQRRIYGHATNVAIHPLDEEKAVQAASDLLGEIVVFAVGGAIVIFEVSRSARSDARKEEARKQELQDLRNMDEQLWKHLQILGERLDELERTSKGGGLKDWLRHPGRLHNQAHSSNKESTSSSA